MRNGRSRAPAGVVRLLALCLALCGTIAAAAARYELIVVRGGTAKSVPVESAAGYPAAPAARLAEALGYPWSGAAFLLEDGPVHFTSGSPFFKAGGEVHQLSNPVYRSGSSLMIPVSWALDWLPRNQPRRWRYLDGRLVSRPPVALRPPARQSWLVVIDPGHGGKDPGAIGVRGTLEKDITLQVARRLAKRLEETEGIEVVLTRDRDTLIAFADRPRAPQLRGRDRPADLFLSIHGNSMPKKPNPARGAETYFLSVANSEKARQVAMRENASLQFESDTAVTDLESLQFILSDLQSTANLRESSLLAEAIHKSFGERVGTHDERVRQAGFIVLWRATMPSALVEVGYLSNSEEEKLLRSSAYQAKIANALAEAVVNYLADYGRRVWSSYSTGG